jgi:hypothetical protein
MAQMIILCTWSAHRHLSNIDCLLAHAACLVCFISTVNGHTKKKRKKGSKCGASSGHITNLEQSIFSFDIYGSTTVAQWLNIFLVIPRSRVRVQELAVTQGKRKMIKKQVYCKYLANSLRTVVELSPHYLNVMGSSLA